VRLFKSNVFFAVAVFCILISCNTENVDHESLTMNASNKNSDFYIDTPRDKIEEMVNKVESLNVGDSYDKIINILGPPTYDKKMYGKKASSPLRHRALYYYIRKYDKDLVNERYDVYLRLDLDNSNQLIRVNYFPKDYNWK
jgi:hypothetical protein